MEGTRHEKVALIVIAYIIGFTTAFIAFGMTQIAPQKEVVFLQHQARTTAAPEAVEPVAGTSVGLAEDGLYAITDRSERLLSANRNALSASAIESVGISSGFYYNIIDAEASRDGKFIYYCEQLSETAQHCDPYVYVLDTDTIHKVTIDGEELKPVLDTHTSAWNGQSTLVVNGAASTELAEPWILSSTATVNQ